MNKNIHSIKTLFKELELIDQLDERQFWETEGVQFEKEISFSNVSFQYPSAKKYALEGINIKIKRGSLLE